MSSAVPRATTSDGTCGALMVLRILDRSEGSWSVASARLIPQNHINRRRRRLLRSTSSSTSNSEGIECVDITADLAALANLHCLPRSCEFSTLSDQCDLSYTKSKAPFERSFNMILRDVMTRGIAEIDAQATL